MYQDISTQGSTFPKTLVIRNTVGGTIWQIYHVDNHHQAFHISRGAESRGFEGVTLEDHNDEEETAPNWRMELAVEFVLMLPNHLSIRDGAVDVHFRRI